MPSVIQELLEDEIILDTDYVRARVAEWKERISHLYSDIMSWFPDLVSDRSDEVVMDEEMMRRFDVAPEPLPILRLSNHEGQVAKFVPHGLWVIGTNGRINLYASRDRFIIIDRSDYAAPASWEIAPSLRRLHREPLTRSMLSRAIR